MFEYQPLIILSSVLRFQVCFEIAIAITMAADNYGVPVLRGQKKGGRARLVRDPRFGAGAH